MHACIVLTGLGRNHSVPIMRNHDLYVQSNVTMNQRMQVITTVLVDTFRILTNNHSYPELLTPANTFPDLSSPTLL